MTEKSEPLKNFQLGVTEAKKFEVPEIKDGIYEANLKDIELKVNVPDGKGGTFDMLQWNFEVDGKIIQGKTSTTMSNLSKAFAWNTAISGKELQAGQNFNPDMIKGLTCQVIVKHQKKSRTFNNEVQQLVLPIVHDVLPSK